MTPRDPDDDLRRQDIDDRRAARRAITCQCGKDLRLSGYCPGPKRCPYSDFAGDEDEEAEHEPE